MTASALLTEDIRVTTEPNQSEVVRTRHLWQSVRTLWLLLPLIYFGTDGFIVELNANPSSATGLTSSQIVVGSAFWLIAIIQMAPAYKQILRACRRNWALTLFTAFAFASALWSPDILDSLRKVVFLSILVLFGYFLAEKYTPEEQLRLIFGVGCIITAGSYLTIFLVPGRGTMAGGEWRGLLGHKNTFGIYLCMYLMSFFFIKRPLTLAKLASISWLLIGLFAIYKSQSRGGWVALIFAVIFIIVSRFMMKLRGKDSLAALFVILTVTGAGIWILLDNFTSFTTLLGKDSSLTGRTDIWAASLWAIGRRLFFGYGYAGFWNDLTPESSAVNVQLGRALVHAHNGVLTLTLQVGIVGMALLAIVLIIAFKNAFRSITIYRSRDALWYLAILLMLLVAGSDESLLMNYLSLMTVLLVMACSGLNQISKRLYTK